MSFMRVIYESASTLNSVDGFISARMDYREDKYDWQVWIEILHIDPLPSKAEVKFHSKQHTFQGQRLHGKWVGMNGKAWMEQEVWTKQQT